MENARLKVYRLIWKGYLTKPLTLSLKDGCSHESNWYQGNWSKDSYTTVFLCINVGSMKTSFDNCSKKYNSYFSDISIYNHLLFLILKKIFKSMLVFKIGHFKKKCCICTKVYFVKYPLVDHFKIHILTGVDRCSLCGKTRNNIMNLNMH